VLAAQIGGLHPGLIFPGLALAGPAVNHADAFGAVADPGLAERFAASGARSTEGGQMRTMGSERRLRHPQTLPTPRRHQGWADEVI